MRWQMAMDTGLSLKAIDRLSLEDISQYLSVKDATAKINAHQAKKKGKK